MKKKLDARLKTLLEVSCQNNHRALLVIIGDRGKNQVVNLHYMLSKISNIPKPSVLWCYKKELGLSSHRKKRMKQIKKLAQRGLLDTSRDDPFEIFVSSTNIRYCYYAETHKILGNTFGMLVLQDFEALTPNILARTVETVQGGGLVVLLLGTIQSLRQLYTMAMDVHDRFRTQAHKDIIARFNERFMLSLSRCQSCLILDDELNVLPLSSPMKEGTFALSDRQIEQITKNQQEWSELKSSLEETPILGELISRTKTLDQAKALLAFIEAITEKTLRSTIALTAARGRGKSAALGLAVAAAIAHQYSNIFVTCPSPENLKSFFDFVLIGFDALQFKEHVDYEILQSTDASLQHCVVRINVFRSHRQTIQYIDPRDASKALHQAELLVIDEAAAIPLPIVKSMLGPYLIFMSSTITGYEGTGRSLSLKLFDQLRKGSHQNNHSEPFHLVEGGRTFREMTLEAPIRYAIEDPIESWLYDVLCLEAGKGPQPLIYGCPHPKDCQLYMVNRDALFSGHPLAESFLQTVMALFVSSHYKNSPNDLQLLSDAPAHRLFVLIAPSKKQLDSNGLPQVLCAIQVCLEGQISKEFAEASMSRGHRGAGDLIPWTVSQQFQDSSFASLSGVRVVRIATHPDVQRMGYGSRALTLLSDYYSGKMIPLTEDVLWRGTLSNHGSSKEMIHNHSDDNSGERLEPRKELPPLLEPLNVPERVDYLGVSYGLTLELFCFWKKQGMVPLYIRLVANEYTGEHTCVMLKQLPEHSMTWLSHFFHDFVRRFLSLLPFAWSNWNPALTLQIIDYGTEYYASHQVTPLNAHNLHLLLSTFDIQRLEAYAKNLIDYHMIVDLLPTIAKLYFSGQLGKEIHLSAAQSAILVSIGLQYMDLDRLEKVLNVPVQQLLALLNKMIRKFAHYFKELEYLLMESNDGSTLGAKDSSRVATLDDKSLHCDKKQSPTTLSVPVVKKSKKNTEHTASSTKKHRKHRLE
ncbi:hypothetical protein GpartN1_g4646.t1 [Galdieria partita]|uniref:RNA cytidine acetyltransferase n=1 Tax=Galdieria partita TaxID=83374 RepID=A0A9C7PYM1_9RHOD|nr:hypothetical protein GpartN1_g4646.t1 [Galdieria partita]